MISIHPNEHEHSGRAWSMSQLARRTNVAFEIDGVDEDARTGWSVQVRGTAERVMQAYDVVELWTKTGPVPWAAGERTLHIAITPQTITGREVVAPSLNSAQ